MSLEAELIYAATSRGMTWDSVQDLELWQIASALGLHRVETISQRDQREIVDAKAEYWEETGEARSKMLAGYSQRRRESKERRKRERTG